MSLLWTQSEFLGNSPLDVPWPLPCGEWHSHPSNTTILVFSYAHGLSQQAQPESFLWPQYSWLSLQLG